MRTSPFVLALGFLIGAATTPVPASAQEPGVESFELSLFPPIQVRGEDSVIRILRLGL